MTNYVTIFQNGKIDLHNSSVVQVVLVKHYTMLRKILIVKKLGCSCPIKKKDLNMYSGILHQFLQISFDLLLMSEQNGNQIWSEIRLNKGIKLFINSVINKHGSN